MIAASAPIALLWPFCPRRANGKRHRVFAHKNAGAEQTNLPLLAILTEKQPGKLYGAPLKACCKMVGQQT